MLPAFDDRHMGAQRLEYRCEFYSDHTAANDRETVVIPGIGSQQPVTRQNARQHRSRNIRYHRFRPRCDNDVICLVIVFT